MLKMLIFIVILPLFFSIFNILPRYFFAFCPEASQVEETNPGNHAGFHNRGMVLVTFS